MFIVLSWHLGLMWLLSFLSCKNQMGVLKNILLNFNSFQTQQFFRFNGDHEYTNMMGGVFTIIIRAVLLILLILKLISVFTFAKVTATSRTNAQVEIVNTTLAPTNQEAPFLFALEVYKLYGPQDLATLKNNTVAWTLNSTGGQYILQQCTPDHWASAPGMYDQLINSVWKINTLLFCLPTNFSHKMSIAQQSALQIDFAFRCRGSCANVSYTKLLVRPIILNRLINSQQSTNYLTSFLDKRRYYGIDTVVTSFDTALNYEVMKFNIDTDSSLWPYESIKTQKGFFLPTQPALSYYPNRYPENVFVRMSFMMSFQEAYHYRSFTKIFDAVSLVGGLIPIFMILFIWLNYYAMAHFQMTFIKRLHSDERAKKYGLFYFISKFFYSFLSFFKLDMKNWQQTQQFHKKHKVVSHLIDILYLYKRLQFLQRALDVILDDHQIKVLHLMRNKKFDEAEENYQRYQMKDSLEKFIEKLHQERESELKTESKTEARLGKEITLEPNQVLPSLDSNKNLITSKQFEGEVQLSPVHHKREIELQQKMNNNGSQFEKNHRQEEEEQSENNENQQKTMLKEAFLCYEILRRQSQDANNNVFYNSISQRILRKLDDTDRKLLEDLQTMILTSEKDKIIEQVMIALDSKDLNAEDSLFRRRKPINLKKTMSDIESRSKIISSKERLIERNGTMDDRREKIKMVNSDHLDFKMQQNKKEEDQGSFY